MFVITWIMDVLTGSINHVTYLGDHVSAYYLVGRLSYKS